MAGGISDDDDEITGINVTPLVDVMLVLLIIFMLTANYVVNRSIEIKLPSADTGEERVTTLNLAFVIDRDSQLYLDGKLVAFTDVPQLIAAARAKEKASDGLEETQAIITADERTPHGTVIKLIDAVRKNGIKEFAINVEVPAAKTESKQ